jgi:hypothetical protein
MTTWVCAACGKTSPNRRGGHPDTSEGWDVSCFLNAVECHTDSLVFGEDGNVTNAVAIDAEAGQEDKSDGPPG